ncbi:GNAT family N-acetyltransferase [Actinopolymorpha alba]|uniref:GNAT family N-acetyltransferase n=1 Tax=Actinopolymorpha alba TaxID=533267 RepID=UPI000370B06D|nr:GNAT family N-acetyltransferase [Actinopolymorpha alba]
MTLWQVRTRVRDIPGTLAQLATRLSRVGGNVVGIDVHGCDTAHVHDDLFVDVPATLTSDELRAALAEAVDTSASDDEVRVRRARAQELVDGPSHALRLAAQLVADPSALPSLLCQLLGGDSAEFCGHCPDETPHQLVVPAPGHGGFVVIRRAWAPFTLIERARVARFVAVIATMERRRAFADSRAILPDGTELRIRAGRDSDVGHVADLLERCSADTRQLRFMSTEERLPAEWLRRLAAPSTGFSVLAFADSGELIGMAQCLPYDQEGSRDAGRAKGSRSEIGLLVEDGWQRRGVGTLLLRTLVNRGRTEGVDEIVAVSLSQQAGTERVFARAGLATMIRYADGVHEVRARLRMPRRKDSVARSASSADATTGPAETAVLTGQNALRVWARSHRR